MTPDPRVPAVTYISPDEGLVLVPKDQQVVGIASVPDVPEEPELPSTPDVPEVPLVPELPDVPEVPEDPDIPDVPEVPLVPELPEVPDVPFIPDVPELPEDPDVPAEDPPVPPPVESPLIFENVTVTAGSQVKSKVPVFATGLVTSEEIDCIICEYRSYPFDVLEM